MCVRVGMREICLVVAHIMYILHTIYIVNPITCAMRALFFFLDGIQKKTGTYAFSLKLIERLVGQQANALFLYFSMVRCVGIDGDCANDLVKKTSVI